MGNLRSVEKALHAAGADARIVEDAAALDSSDALCVPGQGIFGRCITNLGSAGLDVAIARWIGDERPYLGICLGMQVLFESSEERGPVRGLGILGGRVARLERNATIPHIGWNTVGAEYFYFDHSYAVTPKEESIVTGWTDHGGRWAARIEKGPILGVQFHPEKSGRAGIELLRRWLSREES
jgi:imidazole glycerol phosphate synthase glutamine amidotransferase subunit